MMQPWIHSLLTYLGLLLTIINLIILLIILAYIDKQKKGGESAMKDSWRKAWYQKPWKSFPPKKVQDQVAALRAQKEND